MILAAATATDAHPATTASVAAAPPTAVPTATTGVAAPEPIPFRKTSAVSGNELLGTLLTTLLVLAAVAGTAWFARRMGWLARWTGADAREGGATRSIAVLGVRRVSRRTTLYRVSDGRREYLLAESTAQVQLLDLPPATEHAP